MELQLEVKYINFVGLSTLTRVPFSSGGGGTGTIGAPEGGLVGTGVTQLDFRVRDYQTITTPSNGISTINVRGDLFL